MLFVRMTIQISIKISLFSLSSVSIQGSDIIAGGKKRTYLENMYFIFKMKN